MVVKRGGLGRNLSALLNNTSPSPTLEKVQVRDVAQITHLAIDAMLPGKYQPRRDMAEDALLELAQSIKQQGLLQPLVVREISTDCYEIIAGERRWRASQMAGLLELPVIIKQVDDETAMAMALIENLQREDLNAMDQALAMERLVNEFALTHQQIADILCKSRTAVSNYLRLLNLNNDVKRLLSHGDLDMGHARCLLMLDDAQQIKVAQDVVARGLSVRETEALVARLKAYRPNEEAALVEEETPFATRLFNEKIQTLAQHLQTKIKLKHGTNGRGTLMIHFDGAPQLENLVAQIIG